MLTRLFTIKKKDYFLELRTIGINLQLLITDQKCRHNPLSTNALFIGLGKKKEISGVTLWFLTYLNCTKCTY
jgi:hypothetical protein